MPCGWKGPTPAMKQAEAGRKERIRLRDQRERLILGALHGLMCQNFYGVAEVAAVAVTLADDLKRMNSGN